MENMEKLNKKPLRKGDLIQLKIENLDTKGRAYGFYDENKIYTNINAAKDQIVEGIFVKRRHKYELIHCKIIDFAGRKNAIYDDEARQNGGCNYQYYTYEEQLEIKAGHIKKELDRIIKNEYIFEEPVKSPKPEKYRNKMEFSFGNAVKDGPIILGLHKQNSFHDIVEVDGLKLMDDNFNQIYIFCNEFCKKTGYEKALPIIDEWLKNNNPNTRRAVTEGLRIWTSRPYFKENPNEAIERIANLKEDASEYVRKSVGNALRDISKKFPELIKIELDSWKLESKEIQQVYKLASKFIK